MTRTASSRLMETVLVFIMVVIVTSFTWLWRQQVTEKPWLTTGAIDNAGAGSAVIRITAARTGLIVFLAVVTSIFALFISAYFLRMELDDWRPLARACAALGEHAAALHCQRWHAMGLERGSARGQTQGAVRHAHRRASSQSSSSSVRLRPGSC
ncbi:MAG: hypothetical protein U5O39_12715 [Gammaproteobacteria bacterium]|nr:hypothetical protein [Gammaproteobacteria bacterium]